MLNISSIKELLHKPSEIQWNITGTLPGKLKRKIYWALSYKILPFEIIKTWEIAILGGALGKTRKTFQKLHIKFFSPCLIVTSSLLWAFMVQNVCKNSFSGGKSRKNGIPVIKITFSLQKISQNYRFPWVNTKTIKYTCRFNTL